MNIRFSKYACAAALFRAASFPFRAVPLADRVVFLSRQSGSVSLDYQLLAEAFAHRCPDWSAAFSCYKDDGEGLSLFRRMSMSLRQLRLARTSRVVVVDGWNPAVSIPAPRKGVTVVQLWHAWGALKQFGWQSVGKPAGRTKAQAEGLCMHRNYSFVVASGPGAVEPFSQAFDMPESRIKPLGLPSMDAIAFDGRLAQRRRKKLEEVGEKAPELARAGFKVLYAPTFRKGSNLQESLGFSIWEFAKACDELGISLFMVAHPVFTEAAPDSVVLLEGVKGMDVFDAFDYVITDYSAVAFEAGLLHKKVMFFCPDSNEYEQVNGLNVNPLKQFPRIAFKDAAALANRLSELRQNAEAQREKEYEESGFWQFANEYMNSRPGSADRIVDQVLSHQKKNSEG